MPSSSFSRRHTFAVRRQLASVLIVFSLMGVAFPQRATLVRPPVKIVPVKEAPPPLAPSTSVVISQVYGGAGCGTAGCSTYKNDYIELFNLGAAPVSINGWSVQYAAATGTAWQVTALPNVTLQPGQYHLVAESFGANGVNNLPTPDTTGTIAMSATAAKVALVNTTTALSGACPASATIVDLIGYGATASCFETAVAPAPSTTTADIRAGAGCTETDNNSTDFTAIAPNPRNSSTALSPCGGGSTSTLNIGDVTQAEGDAGTSTFTFTVSLTSPAGAGGVSFTVNTANGTTNPATAGSDYVAIVNGSGSIASGATSTTVNVTVNGDTTQEQNETFFVNLTNVTGATAGDTQGLGTITNDDVTLTGICQIQGSAATSPVAGTSASTRGIVTGIKLGTSGGFYIEDDACDADPNTSNGVFVFTGATVPAGAVVGNNVQATGTVQ
ncbi:MAG: lamin tail domain-containing protein, partial [Pyrinomonadaceae bacterium]